jgi:hypothetical protein
MSRATKSSQLQIRVSAQQKTAIRRAAARAGMDMSTFVLSRLLSVPAARFQDAVAACVGPAPPSFALAELNSLLSALSPNELREAVASRPAVELSTYLANYVAAMVEYACERRAVAVPAWTGAVKSLESPVFGSALQSLRLHLLTHSPPPFRRRNIFIDASLGSRV